MPSTPQQVLWFTLSDGTYDTSAEGRVDQKLSDRAYFPGLIAVKTMRSQAAGDAFFVAGML